MDVTDRIVIFGLLECGLVLRALGYGEEPWWARWTAPAFLAAGAVADSFASSEWLTTVLMVLWLAAMVTHLIWQRNWSDKRWSIVDSARHGALLTRARSQ